MTILRALSYMLTDCELNISLDPFGLWCKINNKMRNNKFLSNIFSLKQL